MNAVVAPSSSPILSVRRLRVQFPLRRGWPWSAPSLLRAVEEVNFDLAPGETLGIVGESGCGKSTLARTLVGLQRVTSGGIIFNGRPLQNLDEEGWRAVRRDIQMVFQDPLASLDPRMTVGEIVAEPLRSLYPEVGAVERDRRVAQWLERVGLSASHRNRYPHEFSGGQCQRIGIARALVVQPRLLICDEPVSALDVSVQAQIINLLRDLQKEFGLSMLFIAHDLSVVRLISHRVLVMYLGRIMEQGPRETLFAQPLHPYTKALMAAVPGQHLGDRALVARGEIPSPLNPPLGCVFTTRCPIADPLCTRQLPPLKSLARGRAVACHFVGG
ncbi:ATP-binding cassette domain-containing protein [Solimonas sp. K1W22B-7]|uniref:ABC transporter ATP-binding protein n=1 Tax=Solimonas sp. K1W22B-7 TaxID=2303331 RepID=UPI000E332FA4|nr:oligopeptide/dipeptide ABC transporter ATP-binding protein [Solimonas sp. K1W22B-7]AXQ31196.1 ATP-binding cassette domain-containing protein [Solimonas sp. K1W22B-7]